MSFSVLAPESPAFTSLTVAATDRDAGQRPQDEASRKRRQAHAHHEAQADAPTESVSATDGSRIGTLLDVRA